MQQNGEFLKKKLKFCWKIWWFLAWKNYIFHSIIKLEGHCIEKQIHNQLKKDSSRSDDFLSSYSCSKFEKCSFEKSAFIDKSRQSPNNNPGTAVKKGSSEGCNSETIWDFHLNFNMLFLTVEIIEKCKKNRNFRNFKLVVPLKQIEPIFTIW